MNKTYTLCEDCESPFVKRKSHKFSTCPACLKELLDSGWDPKHKQPANKGDYSPRFNGIAALGEY